VDRIKRGWILLAAFTAIAGCWIGYGAFFYDPVGQASPVESNVGAVNRGVPPAERRSERAAAEEKRPPEGAREAEAIDAEAWNAPAAQSTMAEVAGWERVGPGAWRIPGTATDPAWEAWPVPPETPAGAEPAAGAVARRGASSGGVLDPRRAGREAEIRVECRNLDRAREAYRQATPLLAGQQKMNFRRAFGFGGSSGFDSYGNAEFRSADTAWAAASAQHEVVRALLDAYSQTYGEPALRRLVESERLDVTPLVERHWLREQRRRFITEAFAATRDEASRLPR